MDVFEFHDYRRLIRAFIESKPKKGYGQLSRLSAHAGIHPTYMSQILNGDKNLTEDQGFLVADYFAFGENEALFFLLLIQRERAGSHRVQKLLDKEISRRQQESKKVKSRISTDSELSSEDQAIFYSDWIFTAIHTLSSIERFQSIDALTEHLRLPRPRIIEAVNWLLKTGLCREQKGRVCIGPSTTFVDRDSPHSSRHHANWRLKALEKMSSRLESDFFFTAPFSVSERDMQAIRKDLVHLIDGLAKRIHRTNPEKMATINIDLFQT